MLVFFNAARMGIELNKDEKPVKPNAEIDREETIAAIREGMDAVKRGGVTPVEQVLEEMRTPLGLVIELSGISG